MPLGVEFHEFYAGIYTASRKAAGCRGCAAFWFMMGPMKRFLVEFTHNGSRYDIEIFADTWKEAEERLASLASNGKVYGESVETISACNCPLPLEYTQRM
jgi:hypothetical protein